MKENNKNQFELVLSSTLTLPLVHVDRTSFLHKELMKYCDSAQIETAIEHNPAYAGINLSIIDMIAKDCISYETKKVSAISFVSGIPGGFTMVGTVPADITQYLAHILRILQKLLYLYGWDELIQADSSLDDETTNMLVLFIGVMFGVNGATATITKLSASAANRASKTLASKALTKGTIYPIVKKISQTLGVKMTKEIFAKGVSKVIPVIGGVTSGGLTYLTYKPMAYKLQKYLRTLKWCDVHYYNTSLL